MNANLPSSKYPPSKALKADRMLLSGLGKSFGSVSSPQVGPRAEEAASDTYANIIHSRQGAVSQPVLSSSGGACLGKVPLTLSFTAGDAVSSTRCWGMDGGCRGTGMV